MAARGGIHQHPSQAAGEKLKTAQPLALGAMTGPSKLLQIGQHDSIPKFSTIDASDSRNETPRTWDEVYLLQGALKPSIRSFTRINARTPPFVRDSPWLSYAEQLELLQQHSDRCWRADQRTGDPPQIARLGEWRGGIGMVDEAEFTVTEGATEDFVHEKLRRQKPRNGSLTWNEDTFYEQTYNQSKDILSAADARMTKDRAQSVEETGHQDASKDIVKTINDIDIDFASLDNLIARDPERYLAWLSTVALWFFVRKYYNPSDLLWEDWCRLIAPKIFAIRCDHLQSVAWPLSGPGAIDRTKYGPPGTRPTITLDEAKKCSKKTLEVQNTAEGRVVLANEKAQYFMVNGVAMSRGAAAHYHAIRGEDVWLFEPPDLQKEAFNEPSRQREAEVEASFDCVDMTWRLISILVTLGEGTVSPQYNYT